MNMEKLIFFINYFILPLAFLEIYYLYHKNRIAAKYANALLMTAEKYRALVNNTSEGVFQSTLDGKVLLVNKAGARIFGFDNAEDVIKSGVNVNSLYENKQDRDRIISELLKKGHLENIIVTFRRPDGGKIFTENTVHLLKNERGDILGVEGVFRDVSSRIAMEEELKNYNRNLEEKVEDKANEVLELQRKKFHMEKLAAIGQTATSIVHELRNPLASVTLGLGTVLKRNNDIEEKDKRCLELAVKEINTVEKILKSLLSFSKQQELRFAQHDLNRIVNLAVEQIREMCEQNDVIIKTKYEPDIPVCILDMEKLHQVFYNVLLNAMQAIVSSGQIHINTQYLKTHQAVRILIRDNGPGIPEKLLQKIFEPFFTTRTEGTGLGLAIVEKIVQAHNGQIQIMSQLGQGTSVMIELPTVQN